MRALTLAMQWQIAMEQIDFVFDPAMYRWLEARTGIGDLDGGNLAQIVQSAFYCKGYSASGMDGDWGDEKTEAATRMCMKASISTSENVKKLTDKTLIALFSMDAHILPPGSSEAIREFQRWLHGRYLTRRTSILSRRTASFRGTCRRRYTCRSSRR